MSSLPTYFGGMSPPVPESDSGGPSSSLNDEPWKERELLPGAAIANYRVVRMVGEGGMGRVFEVRHATLRKSFALKLLSERLTGDTAAIDRFRSETLALGKLEHPNIVSAVDAGSWHGQPYLVTQYLQGQDLAQYVASHGNLSVQETTKLAIQIARGLQAAHEVGLFHRDIKPSNLFVEHDGTVKLLDFGLVRSENQPSFTRTGSLMGSVDFLSPEQAEDPRKADARSDIYSFGCTLIYLLSGGPPFPDDAFPGLPSKLLAHHRQEPKWLEQAEATSPHPLLKLIRRMIAKQPTERPESVAEVSEVLKSLLATCSGGKAATTRKRPRRQVLSVFGTVAGAVVVLLWYAPRIGALREPSTIPDSVTMSATGPISEFLKPTAPPTDSSPANAIAAATPDGAMASVPEAPTSPEVKTLGARNTQSAAGVKMTGRHFGFHATPPAHSSTTSEKVRDGLHEKP